MLRTLRAAAMLVLLAGGGWLIYQGVSEYFGAERAQEQASTEWQNAKPVPLPSLETPMRDGSKSKKRQQNTRPETTAPRNWFIPQGEPFSKLEIPKFQSRFYVVEGSDEKSLKKGPGHVRGSAMPGTEGNCVIAGHRDVQFRMLKDIEPGDPIYLETSQGRFCYRVTGTKIVDPAQIEVLQPTPDGQLNLITCYPFYFLGHAPKRFIVTARLDSPSVEQLAMGHQPVVPLKLRRLKKSRSALASSRNFPRRSTAPTGL